MANANIDKMPPRRTSRLRVVPGDGVPRQPLDMANLTILQLRELLGEEYGPRLSDEGGEQVIKLVRAMADKQAKAPSAEQLLRRLLDEQAAALSRSTEELVSHMADTPGVPLNLSPEELVRRLADEQAAATPIIECNWDVRAVMGALKTIDDALPDMATWWASLPPSDRVLKGLTFFAQFVEALPFLRFPLGDYKPIPRNQIGHRKKAHHLWQIPAVLLANLLDKVLRQPGDSELLPFSRGSPLIKAIHTILEGLRPSPPALSAVSSHLSRWWEKPESGGRLPLGATDGHQVRLAQMMRQAELLREEQLRHGTEEKERLERQASHPPARDD